MSNEYVCNFNKELIKLLKFLNNINASDNNNLIIKELLDDNNNNNYLINFWNNVENKSKILSEHNEFLFCKENNLLNGKYNLSIYNYYNNEKMTEDNKKKLWEYLEFLYLYSYSYKSNIDELNSKINNINNELVNKENSETLTSWLAIVDNIKNNKRRIEESENIKDDDENESNDFNIPNLNLPKIDKEMFDKFEKYSEQITDGPIGKLAKDIAGNIDIDNFNNPAELLSSLCSGDLQNNKLMSLINSVGSELQTKLDSNEINQNDLMNDASNIVQNFSGMFGNQMEENIKKASTTNNSNNSNKSNKSRKQKTRERLLRKLEEKKNKNNNNNNI